MNQQLEQPTLPADTVERMLTTLMDWLGFERLEDWC